MPSLGSRVRAAIKRRMYAGFRRDRWQRVDDVVSALVVGPDLRVADIYVPRGIFAGWLGHGTAPDVICREMESAGFHLARQIDFLHPRQNFLVFEKSGSSA